MKQAMAVGGDVLIVAGAGAEQVAEFVVAPTEALGRGEALGRVGVKVGTRPVGQCRMSANNGLIQGASAVRAAVKSGASGAPLRGCGT